MNPIPGNRSQRKLSRGRLLAYRIAVFIGTGIVELLWRTSRLTILNEDRLDAELRKHGAVILSFWHGHLVILARYLVVKRPKGLKLGFVISPSVDGEVAAMLTRIYRGHIIRGSSTYTGARTARHLVRAVNEGISPAITPDGPLGPRFVFKPGALFVSQLCGRPVVPLSYAAKPAYLLRTWDKFVIPVPFARVVIAVGEPVTVPRETTPDGLEVYRAAIQQQLHALYKEADAELKRQMKA